MFFILVEVESIPYLDLSSFGGLALVLAFSILPPIIGIFILGGLLQWFLYKKDALLKYAFVLFVITLILLGIGYSIQWLVISN